MTTSHAIDLEEPRNLGRDRAVVAVVCGAAVAIWAATGAAAAILPAIGTDLSATQSQLQWIADIYPLTLAATLLPAGSILDRHGRRRGLILGLVGLVAGLVGAGLSTSPDQLIIARAISGLGAGFVFPATLATLSGALSGAWRERAVSIWAAAVFVGGATGLLGGAALLRVAWWGSTFLAIAVLAAVCLVLAWFVVPETKDAENASADPLGCLLSMVAAAGLVLGVTEGPTHGWTDPSTLTALGIGLAATCAFATWELRAKRPLIDLRALLDHQVGACAAAIFLVFLTDFGLLFVVFQFLAYVHGYDPLGAALAFLPACVVFLPAALAGPAIARRWSLRVALVGGTAICAVATTLLALGADGGVLVIEAGIGLFYMGVGLVMTPATQSIIDSFPQAEQGVASALNDITREFGAAVGIAVVGAAFNAGYRDRIGELVPAGGGAIEEGLRRSPAAGLSAMTSSPEEAMSGLAHLRSAVVLGWSVSMVACTVLLLIAGIFMWRRLRPS